MPFPGAAGSNVPSRTTASPGGTGERLWTAASAASVASWLAANQSSPSQRADRDEQVLRLSVAVAELPDGDQGVVEPVTDDRHRRREVVIEVFAATGEASQPIEDLEVLRVAFALERIGQDEQLATRGSSPATSATVVVFSRAGGPRALPVSLIATIGADLGCGEEALEVAQTVPTITPGIDPVVAQTTGIAPGADRVRMHAKQSGCLGDRQGRVGGSGR